MTFTPPFNMSEHKLRVVDVEATGLNWRPGQDPAVGYVVTVGPEPEASVYLPVAHTGGGNLPKEDVEAWIKDWASDTDAHTAGHNLKFDLHMAAKEGINFAGTLECTQVNHALLDEHDRYSLEHVAHSYGVPTQKSVALYEYLADKFGGPATRDSMQHYHRLAGDDPLGSEYARNDGGATWQVRERPQGVLEDQGMGRGAALERRVLGVLFRMERVGIPVALHSVGQFKSHVESAITRSRAELPENFNPRSPIAVEKYLRGQGVDLSNWPTTKTGKYSFTKDTLARVAEGKNILAPRKYEHIVNSFLTPLIERHLIKGHVYPQFNQAAYDEGGTVSGRLSSEGPNAQQVPKRDEEVAPLFRSTFTVPAGQRWWAADYEQQEYCIFALYAEAQKIIDGYFADPPVDIHTQIAKELSIERAMAKTVNFLMIYGGSPKALASKLVINIKEAEKYYEQYFRAIPEARDFMRDASRRARVRGWTKTILGRRAHYPNRNWAYKAPNRIIQGTCADIVKQKMVELDDYFRSEGGLCQLFLQVHDDLNWFAPDNAEGERQSHEAKRIMEAFGPDDEITLGIPLRVDMQSGYNWGEASFPGHDWSQYG